MVSKSRGHEGEAVEKQRGGVKDKAEGRQKDHGEDMPQVMQGSTQVDENVGIR